MTMSINLTTMNSRPWVDHHYSSALPRRKSNLRLNDQIIPKPTHINIGEKTIKVPTPKEHPYASHIPRFAMFPSSSHGSAINDHFNVNSTVPKSAPDVTLLSKTKGSAYRHEVLKPLSGPKKTVTWAAEHGFLEYPKPFKGESQVFYPTPKTLMQPKSKVDLPSSTETNNMRKHLEQTHWLTSYQMHYSGFEKEPLKGDNVRKLILHSGRNAKTAPPDGYRSPNDVLSGMIGYPAPLQDTSLQRPAQSAALLQRPQQNSAHYNEEPNQGGHSEPGHSGRLARAQRGYLSRGESHKQRDGGLESEDNITKTQAYMQEAGPDRALKDEGLKKESGDVVQPNSIKTQYPILPGIRPVSEGLSLKELQDSYSKTQAHHRFNTFNTETKVNPRNNVHTGRRHDFYGVNAFYLHG